MTKQEGKMIKIEILHIIINEIVDLNATIEMYQAIKEAGAGPTQYWLNKLAQRLLLKSGKILNEDN